jgi:hypothetical protein
MVGVKACHSITVGPKLLDGVAHSHSESIVSWGVGFGQAAITKQTVRKRPKFAHHPSLARDPLK